MKILKTAKCGKTCCYLNVGCTELAILRSNWVANQDWQLKNLPLWFLFWNSFKPGMVVHIILALGKLRHRDFRFETSLDDVVITLSQRDSKLRSIFVVLYRGLFFSLLMSCYSDLLINLALCFPGDWPIVSETGEASQSEHFKWQKANILSKVTQIHCQISKKYIQFCFYILYLNND